MISDLGTGNAKEIAWKYESEPKPESYGENKDREEKTQLFGAELLARKSAYVRTDHSAGHEE
jgi:hypothetical protein